MGALSLLILVLGAFTGLLLGLLGSGGSILALPAFVYGAHVPIKSAVATSLVVVGGISLFGAVMAQRRCLIQGCPGQEPDFRLIALFGLGGVTGSFGGARLSGGVSDRVQMALFAMVMLGAAAGMFRSRPVSTEKEERRSGGGVRSVGLGMSIGLLTGVIGVGGGFLIVPALSLGAGLNVKRAAGMSLWLITLNSLVGVLGYWGRTPIEWGAAGVFLAGGAAGMTLGQKASRNLSGLALQRAFGVFLVALGVAITAKNLMGR